MVEILLLSFLLAWQPVTTNCDGTPANDVAGYTIRIGMESDNLITSPLLTEPQIEVDDPLPGQVVYWDEEIVAWDWAGNSSQDCP